MQHSAAFDVLWRGASLVSLVSLAVACSSNENTNTSSPADGASGSSGAGGAAQGGSGAGAAGGNNGGSKSTAGGTNAGGTNAGGTTSTGGATSSSGASVLQHHKNATRDGVYVDAAFTKANAAKMHRDTSFTSTLSGPTYAQPLYLEGGAGGKDLVIAATEQNQVSAFDAANGATVWQKTVATPAARSNLPCGNIDPMGITGTPAIDAVSHTIFFDAMTLDSGSPKHKIFALSTDDGSTKNGWPVDVSATAKANGVSFNSPPQGERGAVILLNGNVYVPYGGHYGDCGDYHGWVVGVPMTNPKATPVAWATRARAGGIWAPGGISSDGTSLYVATGNTFSATTWSDGEGIIKLGPTLASSQNAANYFAPTNWQQLDSGDVDIGGSGPIVFDVPGATPSKVVIALGKDGYAYLMNRDNLGGIGGAVATAHVSRSQIINAAVAYTTGQGTYVVFKGQGMGCPGGSSGGLTALKIAAASPPAISVAWCAGPGGSGSPMVTQSGAGDTIVWWVGAEGDSLLHGFDGDTGAVVFGGGSDALPSVARFSTPIAAKGRIFVATTSSVVAFTMN